MHFAIKSAIWEIPLRLRWWCDDVLGKECDRAIYSLTSGALSLADLCSGLGHSDRAI